MASEQNQHLAVTVTGEPSRIASWLLIQAYTLVVPSAGRRLGLWLPTTDRSAGLERRQSGRR